MKVGIINRRRVTAPRKQRGVVLLIALIILVAMTLAGIGMMRSVDTGTVIAGNLAFRQSTLHASDNGISAGYNALVAVTASGNASDLAILNSDNGRPCPAGATAKGCLGGTVNFPGFHSTPVYPCEVSNNCTSSANYLWWLDAANWNNAPSFPVPDPNGGGNIATVSYLIHRMCTTANTGIATKATCQYKQIPGGSNTSLAPPPEQVLYRVTARTVGTRNTVSYTQAFVLNSEPCP